MKIRGRPRKYDWDALFLRKAFTLARGRDYCHSAAVMTQQVRSAASVRGLSITLDEDDGVIRVKVNSNRKG